MHTYDISLTIHPQMPVWPGDAPVDLHRTSKMEQGDRYNLTMMSMSAHVGTHVDAPYHFLGGDSPTVETLPLHLLTGRVFVAELSDTVDMITESVLAGAEIPPRTRRVLFKTRNSALWERQERNFQTDFVALTPDAAHFLVRRGVKLVGVDYLSVAPYNEDTATHQALLEAGIIILEGLDLSKVSGGRYMLYCLPLKIAGADGAPARAILVGA
jgi:arylformamidase